MCVADYPLSSRLLEIGDGSKLFGREEQTGLYGHER
jgi:hypothetical protein